MRYLIPVLLLTALFVGWSRSAVAQHAVRDTVVAGQAFALGWPNLTAPKAYIKIPASAIGDEAGKVAPGTEITISLVTESPESRDHPKRFRKHEKTVFPPIVEFSADPSFAITDANDYLTIAMCVQYRGTPPPQLKLARAPATSEMLEFWPRLQGEERDVLCALRCNPAPPNSGYCGSRAATRFLRQLFAGSPFTATPLYALPEPEGGLGGKGGSTSPFAAVEQ